MTMIDRGFPKAANETLRQNAYRELKRMLIGGRFSPGEGMTIRALSTTLQLGAMPVREAVQQLAAEDALEFAANRTVRVPKLSIDEFRDISEIRALLEGEAAARAATHISPAELAKISHALDRIIVALDNGAPHQGLAANLAFHFGIYRASRSTCLVRTIEKLWLRIGPLLIVPFRQDGPSANAFFGSTLPTHFQLIAALRDRKAEEARQLMREILVDDPDDVGLADTQEQALRI